MCGIVAYSGKNKFNKDKLGLLLLINSLSRGKDATGVFTPTTGLLKDNDPCEKVFPKIQDKIIEDTLFVGHVRAKTIGINSKENAHPFQKNGITLVHNGTLKEHEALAKQMGIDPACIKVDSQVFVEALGLHKNPYVLTKYSGAAALVFTDDSEPDVLYVYRDSERPLYKGTLDDGVYFSSLEDPLKYIGCTDITSLAVNNLYKYKNGLLDGILNIPRPVITYTTPNNSDDYVHRWVKTFGSHRGPNVYGHGRFLPDEFKENTYYFSEGIFGDNVKLKTGKNVYTNLEKYFTYGPAQYKVGLICKAAITLHFSETNKHICDEHEYLMLTAYSYDTKKRAYTLSLKTITGVEFTASSTVIINPSVGDENIWKSRWNELMTAYNHNKEQEHVNNSNNQNPNEEEEGEEDTYDSVIKSIEHALDRAKDAKNKLLINAYTIYCADDLDQLDTAIDDLETNLNYLK